MSSANSVIDLVAGPFSAAVSTIWSGDRLTGFLTATDRRRQVWYACLAADFCTLSPDRNNPDVLHERLTSWRAKDLIVQAYACRPRGVLGVLGRLGSRARDPEVYSLLMAAMERGGQGAKLLMHTSEPSDQLIETMAALPSEIGFAALSTLVGNLVGEVPETLAMLLWTIARLRENKTSRALDGVLLSAQPINALLRYLIDRPLPAPPWEGTNRLCPVTTGPDVLRIGKDFQNCLQKDQWGEAEIMGMLNGTKYLYEWKGKEQALIEMVRVADIGWYVSEAQGIANDRVSQATRREIVNAFATAPHICATRLVTRSNIYPCSHFWGEIVMRAMMR